MMGTLLQDIRYGLRMLVKAPGFTAVAVLTLALGIGANTAIFSVVDAVLLRPLPYRDASRIAVLQETDHRVGLVSLSYPDFLDWRQQSHSFSGMAAVHDVGFDLTGGSEPERVHGYAVSPNFLSLLGLRPAAGRDLLPDEEKPGAAPVALLGYKFWQSHFGGREDAIGKTLELNGRSFTIVGVLPANLLMPDQCDLIAPIGVWAGTEDFTERGSRGDMVAMARLAPGVTLAQARTELSGIAARLTRQFPVENGDTGAAATPVRDVFAGDTRTPLLILFGAVFFVLLIACVNVANLFLVRGAARGREIAVRLAFGASRGRVIRQLLTESFLLAALGGALGLLLGGWGISGLGKIIPADEFAMMGARLDGTVFLFVGAMVFFVALVFGIIPALQATKPDLQEVLKEGGRGSTSGVSQHRLRGVLAIAETALALVLLAGAGLMLESLYRLMHVNPGFQTERVLTLEMQLRQQAYKDKTAKLNFWQQALERVRALPGVETAALGTNVPLTDDHDRGDVTIEGMQAPKPGDYPHPDFHVVSPGYLEALGIPLMRGRSFTSADNETAPHVVMVNSSFARRYWPDGDAVGKRVLFGHPEPDEKWLTVVGVVGDTKLYGLGNPARLEIYAPYRQDATGDMDLVVRSAADPASLTSAIRGAIAAVDRDVPLFGIETMNQLESESLATPRATLVLLGLFSALALVLAAIGIYGVMSYTVALRTHEIGIRMALGAQPDNVMKIILLQGARLALAGVGIGLLAALGLTRLMSSLLYGVSASDPAILAGVALLLTTVALAACYIPARRALRVDPMIALRYE
jgi:putative ABC transport system permease protein